MAKHLTESKLMHFCCKQSYDPEAYKGPIVVKEKGTYYKYYTDRSVIVRVLCEPQESTDTPFGKDSKRFASVLAKIETPLQPWATEHNPPKGVPCCSNPKCDICGGMDTLRIKWHKLAPGVYIDVRYHKAISALPNPRFSLTDDSERISRAPIYFEFDGGIGTVMPVQYQEPGGPDPCHEALVAFYRGYKKRLPGVPVFLDMLVSVRRQKPIIDIIALDRWLLQKGVYVEDGKTSMMDGVLKRYGEAAAAFIEEH